MIEAEFARGEKHIIPGSYVEFAERRVLPQFSDIPAAQIKENTGVKVLKRLMPIKYLRARIQTRPAG